MSNDKHRTLKYFIAYALFREMRYQSHQRQNEKRRQERLHPKPAAQPAYSTWITFGVIMGLLSWAWFALFGLITFFLISGVFFDLFAGIVVILGLREAYLKAHG